MDSKDEDKKEEMDQVLSSSTVQPSPTITTTTATAATTTTTTTTPSPAAPLRYSSRDETYLSQLYSKPFVTTLTSFSHVAHLVRNPYELINNVDEIVKQASGNSRKYQRTSENFVKSLQQNRPADTPSSPVGQEMDTFVASSHDQSSSTSASVPQANKRTGDEVQSQLPINVLPPIECSKKRGRLSSLTIEEYENQHRQSSSDLELIERVFYGSMSCNQLRAALWPYLFGLVPGRGRFEKVRSPEGAEAYLYIEHEDNTARWQELQKQYYQFQAQWMAIQPDQETRFSTFRERKSLIERDVIRCDRLHPFYAEAPQNLAALTNLLMTYMMYDFDIGYVQGMSDLAGPILFMYKGDLVKAFWVFVEVMKLFRRNFELTQKTIHFQLNCLHELIKQTDRVFAQYLEEHESSNCFFAFRAIVCQFKRELMKEDEDDYSNVLFLWDTIWSAARRHVLSGEARDKDQTSSMQVDKQQTDEGVRKMSAADNSTSADQTGGTNESPFFQFDPNQADSPRYKLTETEIFVLALCLSMIRRERDIIMANRLDGTDIHLHFIDPKLATDLNGFIEHAINIYSFLKSDFDVTKLTSPKEQAKVQDANPESPLGSAEGYDLLSDFLVINAASGT